MGVDHVTLHKIQFRHLLDRIDRGDWKILREADLYELGDAVLLESAPYIGIDVVLVTSATLIGLSLF